MTRHRYVVLAVVGCAYVVIASFLGHLLDGGDSDASAAQGGAGEMA